MLVRVEVENFKSFYSSAVLNLEAGSTSKLVGSLLRARDGRKFVKSLALYGKNASGKTTVLDALFALKRAVSFSSEDQKPTARVPRFESFALGTGTAKAPARVAVTVVIEDKQYTYDVAATSERIWSETLSVTPVAQSKIRKAPTPATLIARKWNPDANRYAVDLAEELGAGSTLEAVREQTPPNRLILGKLASLNSAVATDLLEWFEQDLDFHDMHRNEDSQHRMLQRAAELFKDDEAFAQILSGLLTDADTGVERLISSLEKVFEPVVDKADQVIEVKERMVPGLNFRHTTRDGSEIVFRPNRESSGTLRFVAMLAAILQPGKRARVVCVDELSASLHPDLVRALVKIAHSRRLNPRGNQLLFTTHDTHLMNPIELLRRDQIFLCEKNRFGESSIVRLDAFQDNARSDANLQKQYLENRFGGLPQFGPSLEDVPVDDAPLEVMA